MDEAVEAIDSKGFTDVTGDNIKRLQTVYKVIEEGVDPDSAISQVLAETNKKGFTRDQYRSQLIRDGLSDEAIEVEMGFNFVPDPVDEIYNNVIGDKDIPNEGEVKAKIRTMLDKGYRPETIGSAIEEFKPKRGPATRGSVPEFLDPVTEKLAELAESFRGIEGSAPAGRPSPVAGIGDFIEKKGQEFNENFAKTQQSTILGTMEGLTKRLGESTKKNQKEAELNLTREHEKTVRDRGPKGIGPRLPEADEFNLLNDLFFNLNPSRNP